MLGVLSRAAYKRSMAVLRSLRAATEHPRWTERAELCARCPVAVTGKRGVVYCGKPFLQQLHRAPHEGCGCPVADKARDPGEHCPVNLTLDGRIVAMGVCDCRWCKAGLGPPDASETRAA
jgi:hypothetical protein